MAQALAGFESATFTHGGDSKRVFRRGEGPGVIVMTEIPGITPSVAELARVVADDGFTVLLPDILGQAGRELSRRYMLRSMSHACISREFTVLSTRKRSPITEWLRALARSLHEELGGPGVGAIGMCLTGNFALALMLDPWLQAPVLSQPSLPFGFTKAQRRALHLGEGELEVVRKRAQDEGVPVLGLRFTGDPLCPRARFDRLHEELGAAFEEIEIDSSPGNPHGIPRTAHSVITQDLVDEAGHPTLEARERVLAFLHERLRGRT